MMGVGKSTIGKLLSKKIKMGFVDIDSIIEKKLSLSVQQIFKNKGENFFREIEEKQTLDSLESNDSILALGGGAFLNKKIRAKIGKSAISVWLDLSPKQLFERTKNNDKRPLLNNVRSEKDLENLYKKRESIYSLADFRLNCNLKTKEEIVEEILKIYESINNKK